jgi:hypothetical protein
MNAGGEFEGFDFIWCIDIPHWVRWLAQDKTGLVFGYSIKPMLSNDYPYWRRRHGSAVIQIGLAGNSANWRENIMKVPNVRQVESKLNYL